jgi:hypothetical protein
MRFPGHPVARSSASAEQPSDDGAITSFLVNVGQANGGVQLETMIGIAALLVGAGVAWLCFAAGVYFFTRTGREGMRIARMEEEQRHRPPREI